MMEDGERIPIPCAAKAIELGLGGKELSTVACALGVRGTTLTRAVIEASESEAASFPSMEVVGVNGGVAGVTTEDSDSGVDGFRWRIVRDR